MSADGPRDLAELAARMRRAADRLVMLRLRVARSLAEAGEGAVVEADRWNAVAQPAVAAGSALLRRQSAELRQIADALDDRRGARLGGHDGAGYLGAGRITTGRLQEIATALGARPDQGVTVEAGHGIVAPSGERPSAHEVSEALGSSEAIRSTEPQERPGTGPAAQA